MARPKKQLEIMNPALARIVQENETARLAHLAKLDSISHDIKALEYALSRSALPNIEFSLNDKEFLLWNGNRIIFFGNGVNSTPLIETPLTIRLKHFDRLGEFAQLCFNKIKER